MIFQDPTNYDGSFAIIPIGVNKITLQIKSMKSIPDGWLQKTLTLCTQTSSCCTVINTQITGCTLSYIRRKSHSKSSVFFWSFDVKLVLIISSFFSGTVPLCWPMVAAVKRCVLREHLEEVLERWRAKGEKNTMSCQVIFGQQWKCIHDFVVWFWCSPLLLGVLYVCICNYLCIYMYLCRYSVHT